MSEQGHRVKYDLNDWDNLGNQCFLHFRAEDSDGITVEIITNIKGEGRWEEWYDGLHQVSGTCQYRLPQTKGTLRRQLRKMLEEKREWA